MYFLRYSVRSHSPGFGNIIVPIILVILLYCNCHIIYCKWQQNRKEKDDVIPIQILPNGREMYDAHNNRHNHDQRSNQSFRLNNTIHNKILPEIKHITWVFVYIIVVLVALRFRSDMIQSDIKSITIHSKIWLYVLDFGPINILMLLYPLMFYLCHKELILPFCNNSKNDIGKILFFAKN